MKPKGLSRQAYRDMVSIIRELCGADNAIVGFHTVEDALNAGEPYATGWSFRRHEEGYSSLSVTVYLAEPEYGNRAYVVSSCNYGRDCDGRTCDSIINIYVPAQKRKRWYWSKNLVTGKPEGRFNVKSPWRVIKQLDRAHRDYSAEAMGY